MAAPSLSIAHVVLSLDIGGLERNIVNQVREAPRLGQRVSVICVERPGALAAQVEGLGARVVCLRKSAGLRPATVARMTRILGELRPHVVHTHQVGALCYTGPAARLAGVPLLVHTEHGKENYAGRPRRRWLGRIGGHFTRRFYCLTQDMADAVLASRIVPRRKVRVIQNGIDTSCYAEPGDTEALRHNLGIPVGAPVVGTVGRLAEVKRQDLLLRCFAAVHESVPQAHLLLVGDGPLLSDLKEQAGALGLNGSVHFVGYQAQTAPYLHLMNVFTLTSRSEGMPQSALEAAVAGVPTIATRVGGLPELIRHGETGLLVDPSDEQALATGLCSLLNTPETTRRMGVAAKARVESMFHIRRMAHEYHLDYLEMLGRVESN